MIAFFGCYFAFSIVISVLFCGHWLTVFKMYLHSWRLKCTGRPSVANTHTHTHPFNGPLSGTTRMSRYQKGKTNLDLLKQETVSGSGIRWTICKSAPRSCQITTPVPHHSIFYRPDALPAAQQHQSTEGTLVLLIGLWKPQDTKKLLQDSAESVNKLTWTYKI